MLNVKKVAIPPRSSGPHILQDQRVSFTVSVFHTVYCTHILPEVTEILEAGFLSRGFGSTHHLSHEKTLNLHLQNRPTDNKVMLTSNRNTHSGQARVNFMGWHGQLHYPF